MGGGSVADFTVATVAAKFGAEVDLKNAGWLVQSLGRDGAGDSPDAKFILEHADDPKGESLFPVDLVVEEFRNAIQGDSFLRLGVSFTNRDRLVLK